MTMSFIDSQGNDAKLSRILTFLSINTDINFHAESKSQMAVSCGLASIILRRRVVARMRQTSGGRTSNPARTEVRLRR